MAAGSILAFGLFTLLLVLDGVSAHIRSSSRYYGGEGGMSARKSVHIESSMSRHGSQGYGATDTIAGPMMGGPLMGGAMAEPGMMGGAMAEPGMMGGAMAESGMMGGAPAEPGMMGGAMAEPLGGAVMVGSSTTTRIIYRRSCSYCPARTRCIRGIRRVRCMPYGGMMGGMTGGMMGGMGVCGLFKDPGSCPTSRHIRWFYDSDHGHCDRFNWSGCGGNRNRFISRAACEMQCGRYNRLG